MWLSEIRNCWAVNSLLANYIKQIPSTEFAYKKNKHPFLGRFTLSNRSTATNYRCWGGKWARLSCTSTGFVSGDAPGQCPCKTSCAASAWASGADNNEPPTAMLTPLTKSRRVISRSMPSFRSLDDAIHFVLVGFIPVQCQVAMHLNWVNGDTIWANLCATLFCCSSHYCCATRAHPGLNWSVWV